MARDRALGRAAETGTEECTTEILADPVAFHEFRAPDVPGVTIWKALFWSTVVSSTDQYDATLDSWCLLLSA
jgi:hypothetical protein